MKKFLLGGLLGLTLMAFSSVSEACTGIRLTTREGQTIHGRTLEFGVDVETSVVVIPRGYTFAAVTPNGKGLTYQAKHAAIGAICYNNMAIMDGMNEQGLSVGSFYFPGFANYTPTTPDNQQRSLSPIDFSNWIVTQFATVEEVKEGVKSVVIAPTVFEAWGKEAPPFHYIVYDKNGKSIVIEPVDGKLIVHENPLGVLTNSPTFDWHLTYLRNFINLTPDNVPPKTINGLTLAPFGQGSGMVGMPGDFTPPSRFVRASIYSLSSITPPNADAAVFQVFHILNQFDIPVGVARDVRDGKVHSDYTIATVVRDPVNLKYYFRTYQDQTIKMVDLKRFDRNASDIKVASTSGHQSYVDVSDQLQPYNPNQK